MNPYWRNSFSPFPGAGMSPYMKYPGPPPNYGGYNNHQYNPHQQHITAQSNVRMDEPDGFSQRLHCTKLKTEDDLYGNSNESHDRDSDEDMNCDPDGDMNCDPDEDMNCDPDEEPDGLPYELDEEDPELTRKRKELQKIEEQIMLKKASLAQRTVNIETAKPGLCHEEPKPIKLHETLREKVKHILKVRNRIPTSKGSLVTSRRRSFNAQHDHPLRFRVAVALQQRFDKPHEEPHECELIPFIKASPPRPKEPEEEVNSANQGFMRFLNILNKGVDIDKLKEIVNDHDIDNTDVHSSQNGAKADRATHSAKPPVIVRGKIPESYGFTSSHKGVNINNLTDIVSNSDDIPLISQNGASSSIGRPVIVREKLPENYQFNNQHKNEMDHKVVNDNRGDFPHSSQHGPKSNSATSSIEPSVIVRETLPKEEQSSIVEDPQKHLRNVLESLGLSLETEEIDRLGDRTQERLYGKKHQNKTEGTKISDASEVKSHIEEQQQKRNRTQEQLCGKKQRTETESSRVAHATEEKKTERQQQRGEKKHSPAHDTSKSPSSHPRDLKSSILKHCSPILPNPYPYLASLYSSPDFLPKIAPKVDCQPQPTNSPNKQAKNNTPVPGPQHSTPQNTSQISTLTDWSQPNSRTQKKKNTRDTRCLVPLVVPKGKTNKKT